jgi:hypothetical protein
MTATTRPEPPAEPDDPNGPPHYRPYWQQYLIVLGIIFGGTGLIIGGCYALQSLLRQ